MCTAPRARTVLVVAACWATVAFGSDTPPAAGDASDADAITIPAAPTPGEDQFWQALALLDEPDEAQRQRGRELMRNSADQENVAAELYLGESYLRGSGGFPKQERRAFDWFRLAAAAGYRPAQAYLGICYAAGLGTTKNFDAAKKWLTEAVADADAFRPPEPPSWFRERQAERAKASATEPGDGLILTPGPTFWESLLANAHFHLGEAFAGTNQPTEALAHYEIAANFGENHRAGIPAAAREAAMCYALGRGTPRDLGKANARLELSRTLIRKQGLASFRESWSHAPVDNFDQADFETDLAHYADAQLQYDLQDIAKNLARTNPAEAVKWCELAAANGEGWAMLQLAELHGTNATGTRDPVQAFTWWRRAAEEKDLPLAWANLAVCHQRGFGTEPDRTRAEAIVTAHHRDNFMCALIAAGTLPGDDLSYNAWVVQLKDAALKKKLPVAQYHYAMMLFNSPENVALRQQGKAVKDFRRTILPGLEYAAAAGVPEALLELGMFYRHGIGVATDLLKARTYLEKGMATGSSGCALELGAMELQTLSHRAVERAITCFQRALEIEPDNAEAHNDLGVALQTRLLQGERTEVTVNARTGEIVNTNRPLALAAAAIDETQQKIVEQFTAAERFGSAFGAYNLGNLYYDGAPVSQDFREAYLHFQTAADRGHVLAHRALGQMHDRGEGVPETPSEALYYYRIAALEGDLPSLRKVCDFYEHGRGVEMDYEQAKAWFMRLTAAGDPVGIVRFGDILHRQQRYVEERKFWRELQNRSDLGLIPGYALDRLSVLYAEGLGVPADPRRAKQYSDKAIAMDNIDALSRRGRRLMASGKPDEARKYLEGSWMLPSAEFLYLQGVLELWATAKHPRNEDGWKLLQRAAKLGSVEAKLRLAQATAVGENNLVPLDQALEYAREAEAANLPEAASVREQLEARQPPAAPSPPPPPEEPEVTSPRSRTA